MYTKTKKRVFISFNMENLHAKKLLESQAKDDRFDLEFINYSVNEPFTEKWKTQCKERIAKADIVICMVGQKTYSRPAVIWELETAYTMGKKVFAIRIHRDRFDPIPSPITLHGSTVIKWDIGTINNEIKKRM
jgi:hypothetical protein